MYRTKTTLYFDINEALIPVLNHRLYLNARGNNVFLQIDENVKALALLKS